MKTPSVRAATSFLGAAAAIAVFAVVARVCPGGCTACGSCASGVGPAVGGALAVGSALVGSAWTGRRPDAEKPDDTVGPRQSV